MQNYKSAMLGMLGAAALVSAGIAAPSPARGNGVATPRANAAKANTNRSASTDTVQVAQRYRPVYPRIFQLPKSKNPPTKKLRGKTNRRKAALKAKRRRARR